MSKSKIEWTEQTWNPIVGCSKVSAGCKNCYAERMAWRLANMGQKRYEDVTTGWNPLLPTQGKWNGKTVFVESALQIPLKRKKATTYFVCSMSDLFHESVPFEWIDRVMFTIYKSYKNGHTFQILTKRPERMAEYFLGDVDARILKLFRESDKKYTSESRLTDSVNMLSRVLLGTTVEHPDYKHRLDDLRKCPASVRFVSGEPLLADLGELNLDGIGWFIVGGESGPGARPMHPDWARGVRDQCKEAGVPFFFKQWGEWGIWEPVPADFHKRLQIVDSSHILKATTTIKIFPEHEKSTIPCTGWAKVGKKKAGCLLDGVEHKEYPK